jgi:hypothetical protein
MEKHVDALQLNAWLQSQWSKLEKALAAVERNDRKEEAIAQIEAIVQGYKEKADEGDIFETVFGFEETVFCALEILAIAYTRVARFDEALNLHRYVVESVQSIVRNRHRNQGRLQDLRDSDIEHIMAAIGFLVRFSQHAADQGDNTPARQLLNEAKRLSKLWDLTARRPEINSIIQKQAEAIE